jgi:predicted small integral membrane protein
MKEKAWMIRNLKICLVLFSALLCLMYAGQNLVNLSAAYNFVADVVTMSNHVVYPASFGPAVHSPFLITTMLVVIIVLEIIAGLVAAKGALDLWQARSAGAEEFNNAKTFAVLGCGLALVIWFGLFASIGGAYFQMWQTELGAGALQGAFQYAVLNGIVLLFVNSPDV